MISRIAPPMSDPRRLTPALRLRIAKRGLKIRAERYKRLGLLQPQTTKGDLSKMTDAYSKVALTVIAVCLCAITAKLYVPAANDTGPAIGATTMEQLMAAKNDEQRGRLMRGIPLVRVQGGDIDAEVTGSVSIDNQ